MSVHEGGMATGCCHVGDPDLAEWYAKNPHLTCARCWLEGAKVLQ